MSIANPPPQKVPDHIGQSDPALFDYLTQTQFQQYQMWVRSGGGADILAAVVALADNLNHISSEHESSIGKIRAVNRDQANQIAALIALAQVDRQNIADLIADNGKLRARLNASDAAHRNTQQILAGID